MTRFCQLMIAIAVLVGSAVAQTAQSTELSRRQDVFRQWCRGLLHVETPEQREVAERRDAQRKDGEFLMKMKRFTKSWSALAREYNGKGTFNVRTAKEVSNAFHDLEKTEGWPKTNRH